MVCRCPTGVTRSQQSWSSSRCHVIALPLCSDLLRDWLRVLSLFSCAPASRWAPLSYQPDQLRQRVCFGSTLRVEQSSSLIVSSSRPEIPREFRKYERIPFCRGSRRFLLQQFLVAGATVRFYYFLNGWNFAGYVIWKYFMTDVLEKKSLNGFCMTWPIIVLCRGTRLGYSQGLEAVSVNDGG